MTRRKGLTEYNWRILSRLLERHYSVRTAFEFLRKSEPENRPLNLICDGLDVRGTLLIRELKLWKFANKRY